MTDNTGASVPDRAFVPTASNPQAVSTEGFNPSPDALLALAERCEQVTGEDAYLDLDIYKALDPDGYGDIATLTDAPNYCGSLDAAMTLVECGRWSITAASDGRSWQAATWPAIETGHGFDWRQAATPALALCAAALRSRAGEA